MKRSRETHRRVNGFLVYEEGEMCPSCGTAQHAERPASGMPSSVERVAGYYLTCLVAGAVSARDARTSGIRRTVEGRTMKRDQIQLRSETATTRAVFVAVCECGREQAVADLHPSGVMNKTRKDVIQFLRGIGWEVSDDGVITCPFCRSDS